MCLYINQVLVVKTLSISLLLFVCIKYRSMQCNAERHTNIEIYTMAMLSYMLYFTKANLLSFTKLQLVKVGIYVM
jgi:hypothetical protein